jgi:hypothetical protein
VTHHGTSENGSGSWSGSGSLFVGRRPNEPPLGGRGSTVGGASVTPQ